MAFLHVARGSGVVLVAWKTELGSVYPAPSVWEDACERTHEVRLG